MLGKIKGHDQKPQAIDIVLLQVFQIQNVAWVSVPLVGLAAAVSLTNHLRLDDAPGTRDAIRDLSVWRRGWQGPTAYEHLSPPDP